MAIVGTSCPPVDRSFFNDSMARGLAKLLAASWFVLCSYAVITMAVRFHWVCSNASRAVSQACEDPVVFAIGLDPLILEFTAFLLACLAMGAWFIRPYPLTEFKPDRHLATRICCALAGTVLLGISFLTLTFAVDYLASPVYQDLGFCVVSMVLFLAHMVVAAELIAAAVTSEASWRRVKQCLNTFLLASMLLGLGLSNLAGPATPEDMEPALELDDPADPPAADGRLSNT